MSAADRLGDGFPHGTREGFDAGCRGSGCPAGAEHGLSCKRARQLAAGDYRYQKLARAGSTPAEIADALGLVPEIHTAPKRKPVVLDDADDVEVVDVEEKEEIVSAVKPAPKPKPMKPAARSAAAAPKPKRKSPAGPSQSEVRAWAREQGIEVNPRGMIAKNVVERYLSRTPSMGTTPVEASPERVPFTEPQHAELDARTNNPALFAAADDAVDPAAPSTVEVVVDTLIDQEELELAWLERDTARAALELALQKWSAEQTGRRAAERLARELASHAVHLEREAHHDAVHLESMDRAIAQLTAERDALAAEVARLRAAVTAPRPGWWTRRAS